LAVNAASENLHADAARGVSARRASECGAVFRLRKG